MQSQTYYEAVPGQLADPIAVVVSCGEHEVQCLLVDEDALPAEFCDLSTGVAGELLNKLTMYRIRMAAVVPDPSIHSTRFQEFARESNRGRQVRFFTSRADAIDWLESG